MVERVVHALDEGSREIVTLCGKGLATLESGESAISAAGCNREWISCAKCRGLVTETTVTVENYEPRCTLKVPQTKVTHARYWFIDVHSHHDSMMSPDKIEIVVAEMDRLKLETLVNLNGGFGERLQRGVLNLNSKHPGRFLLFANIDFSELDSTDYPRLVADRFEHDVQNGAQGLKIFKNLGMDLRDKAGRRLPVDDARFDLLFEACASLRTPVLIHTADPKPFFEPVDRFNERWLELKSVPSRRHFGRSVPSWEVLIEEQHRLFARHPKTIFINAHLGWLGGDLDRLGTLLGRLPNVYTEFGAVIAELGRQPRQARAWFVRYQDRILFGKDAWNPEEYPTCFRVLETADEYFDHYRSTQARWKLYGLDLPDAVLRKVYFENALRILPRVNPEKFSEQ